MLRIKHLDKNYWFLAYELPIYLSIGTRYSSAIRYTDLRKHKKMKTGIVKWFNNAKGYGFILSDEDSKDIFAHYSSIEMDGYRTLRAGQCVAFEAIDGPKGLHAMNIKVLEEVIVTDVPRASTADTDSGAPSPKIDIDVAESLDELVGD